VHILIEYRSTSSFTFILLLQHRPYQSSSNISTMNVFANPRPTKIARISVSPFAPLCTGHVGSGVCKKLSEDERKVVSTIRSMNPPVLKMELFEDYSKLSMSVSSNDGNSAMRSVTCFHATTKVFECYESFLHDLLNSYKETNARIMSIGHDEYGKYLQLNACSDSISTVAVDNHKNSYCGRPCRVYCKPGSIPIQGIFSAIEPPKTKKNRAGCNSQLSSETDDLGFRDFPLLSQIPSDNETENFPAISTTDNLGDASKPKTPVHTA